MIQSNKNQFVVILGLAILLSVADLANAQSKNAPSVIGKVNLNWNQVFEFKKGWVGGDGAGSIDLQDGRVVWLFGDSLIGGVRDGKYASGTHMVNNAIAVQKLDRKTQPKPQAFRFVWGAKNRSGKPTAWAVPDPDKVKPTVPITNEKYPDGWYWPAGGGCLIESNRRKGEKSKRKKLVAFMFHVGRTDKERGVWSFKNIGGAMIIVDNPEQPVEQWRSRQLDLPFTIDLDQVAIARKKEGRDRQVFETNWGMACLVESAANDVTQWVYIYGTRQKTKYNRQLIVARVPAKQIEDFQAWNFYAGKGRWTTEMNQVKSVADRMAAEFSVHQVSWEGKEKYVLVQSDPMLGTRIYARTSRSPVGPWSKRLVIYDVPDVRKSKNYFTYAAKAHAELSPRGKLLISYVVNSQDFWEMLRDSSIYRPRFIELPIQTLLEPEQADSGK